jgi:hypothetical protein
MTEPRDWLDEALAQPAHIDDAGFTEQVLARLPARRRRPWLRDAVLALALIGGGCLAFVVTPGARVLAAATAELERYQPGAASLPVLPLLLVLALIATSAVVVGER